MRIAIGSDHAGFDMTIPRCVANADEAIALIHERHTTWHNKKEKT